MSTEDLVKIAGEMAKQVEPSEKHPSTFRSLGRFLSDQLVKDLREMESVDPSNDRLRGWAEDLVTAFNAVAAAYDDICERMTAVRGSNPEIYAHLYLDINEAELLRMEWENPQLYRHVLQLLAKEGESIPNEVP